jgi:hypothetical protein
MYIWFYRFPLLYQKPLEHFTKIKSSLYVTCASKTGIMSAALFLRKMKITKIVRNCFLKTMGVDSCFSKMI